MKQTIAHTLTYYYLLFGSLSKASINGSYKSCTWQNEQQFPYTWTVTNI